ncbi:AsnC family transcriptional regulator [Acetobacter sp. TBRC 12305]|uniref:Lrp/AsnC family transcriptional regulator n=1 Tax=Acetobacter garciniae TaxID=2817435 RepID=A0A939KQ46_9PROT|nr:Lrp/AsnC family transcriptional regulator [Acetobacter garciniae]MBO1324807.1 Lrp/AsnC family transcriptional regulator [Acetobacter garciniae]MBX0344498.1 AsnC family transcriptional regulator [Acetobacter garciniae]
MTPDTVDRTLIALLRKNARISTVALAQRVGMSRTTVQSRIERLEQAGVILGYTIQTIPEADEVVKAHVMITVVPRLSRMVETALQQIGEIRELHAVSGEIDLIAVIAGPSTEKINDVIDRIGQLEGVRRTTSSILLSTRLNRKG